MLKETFLFYISIDLGKSHEPSEQPFQMHQPDSRIKKKKKKKENTMLKDFDCFISDTKSKESALKRHWQANGLSSNIGYIFSFKPFWKTCFTVFWHRNIVLFAMFIKLAL